MHVYLFIIMSLLNIIIIIMETVESWVRLTRLGTCTWNRNVTTVTTPNLSQRLILAASRKEEIVPTFHKPQRINRNRN